MRLLGDADEWLMIDTYDWVAERLGLTIPSTHDMIVKSNNKGVSMSKDPTLGFLVSLRSSDGGVELAKWIAGAITTQLGVGEVEVDFMGEIEEYPDENG